MVCLLEYVVWILEEEKLREKERKYPVKQTVRLTNGLLALGYYVEGGIRD